MHVKLLLAGGKDGYQTEMKVGTAHQNFPVERLTAVTDMIPVNKPAKRRYPDSENKKHLLR